MKTLIIDTREPHEYKESHAGGAINIPPHEFMKDSLPSPLDTTSMDDEIILYCRSGMRSNTVGHILRQRGFENIVNGINEHHVAKMMRER